jgi:ferrochelatase
MLEVAGHYQHFGGKSPINDQMRALIAALKDELARRAINLPVYWGNRNWHPLLPAVLREMAAAGSRRALAWVAAAWSSYSSCRQYLEDIERARTAAGTGAPRVDKIRPFFNHPDFVAANASRLVEAFGRVSAANRDAPRIFFTAHSLPESMARRCAYASQLMEACRLVAGEAPLAPGCWQLVYQSRSGRPQDPWLGPDILDALREAAAEGVRAVVAAPIGFLSDHMEVLYDLDIEARQAADAAGIEFVRAATPGVHPRFVQMVASLVSERLGDNPVRLAVGALPAWPDACPSDCCPAPAVAGRGAP